MGMVERGFSEHFEKHGLVAVTTIGFSMYPMLYHRRDCVVIEKYLGGAEKYDILLYRTPADKLILHRVIENEKIEGKFVIRGDNCLGREYVPEEWVIGKVIEFTRKNKNYKVTDRGYRLYSKFIVAFHPLVAVKLRAGGIVSKILEKISENNLGRK